MYYYISLGSNIAPEINIGQCIELLLTLFNPIYLYPATYTAPEKIVTTSIFINALAVIKTDLDTTQLKPILSNIEERLGRDRSDKLSSLKDRPCDLDILGQSHLLELHFFASRPERYLQEVLNPQSPKANITIYDTILPNRATTIYFERSPRHKLVFIDEVDAL